MKYWSLKAGLTVGACLALAAQFWEPARAVEVQTTSGVPSGASAGDVRQAPEIGTEIATGDVLRLAFYERLESDEDKWRGASGRPGAPRGFHQRTELSGEYQVQDDGTISLPMLGRFAAVGLTFDALQGKLSQPFEALIERKGFVNVLAVERQPIYIVGPIKNPGAYKFQAGMTVLHAVALAGGFRKAEPEPWQRVDAVRQFEALQKSLERVKRLAVRLTVLKGERDRDHSADAETSQLVGSANSRDLTTEEVQARSLANIKGKTESAALETALADARSELDARVGRIKPFDDSIRLRRERVQSIQQLVGSNIISRPQLVQVQSDLSDAEDRRQQALIDIEAARRRVTQAEHAFEQQKSQLRVELDSTLAATRRDTTDVATDADGQLSVLKMLTAGNKGGDLEGTPSFEIVRRRNAQPRVLPVAETANLQPGDLIRVISSDVPSR